MLTLGVDVTWLPHDRRGMGRYVRSVLQALRLRDDVALVEFERSEWKGPSLDGRALDACWFPWNRVDAEPRCPRLVTIHDTAAFDWPIQGALSFLENRKAQGRLRQAAARAGRVMTVSTFSRDQIHRHLDVPLDRIDVVMEGVDSAFVPCPDPPAVRARESSDKRFALFVGARDPRKNLDALLRAWPLVGAPSVDLLIAGCTGTPVPGIRYLGEIDDARLRALYGACSVYVMPSLYEGFGLPVLEAMASGALVAAARAASLPEVGGDVPFWFDPHDPADIARAIREALADTSDARRKAGLHRAAEYTWERAAAQVMESVRRAAPR